MLRLFSDCLDISQPNGDGWIVHYELKKSYNRENVPLSQTSITWLLRATSAEKFVVCGPRTVWSCVQHAVRSFLVHEQSNQVLHRLLGLSEDSKVKICASRATAFAHWFALQGSGRELLPMVLQVGAFCQIRGFDWVSDDVTVAEYIKALPVLYATWAIAMPNNMDRVKELIQFELEMSLQKLGWTHEAFIEFLSSSPPRSDCEPGTENAAVPHACSTCGDCYGQQGYGLVQPAYIAFLECVRTDHRLKCNCKAVSGDAGTAHFRQESPDEDDSDVDEFFDAETTFNTDIKFPHFVDRDSDPFLDAAIMLYRAQGRNWLGDYAMTERLCATCFLLREKYIGEEGIGTECDFPPIPEGFEMFRADVKDCVVEVASN